MANVRGATTTDIPALLPMLEAFSKTLKTSKPLFPTEEHARAVLEDMIAHHVVLVAESDDGRPIGTIAGLQVPHPFNPEIRLLAEAWWWVAPEGRGTSAGLRLLEEFTEIGRTMADWVTMNLEHDSPVREETLVKRGFRPFERAYLMEVA